MNIFWSSYAYYGPYYFSREVLNPLTIRKVYKIDNSKTFKSYKFVLGSTYEKCAMYPYMNTILELVLEIQMETFSISVANFRII